MKQALCLSLLCLLSFACAPVHAQQADPPRPNVILIVTDDQGWNDIGYHNEEVRTPNMDRLCAMGVELNAHYVQPQCTPTRVALMTGRYPSRFGPGSTTATNNPAYPIGTLTMASMFQSLGYDTAIIGKWHMGSDPEHGPNFHGFDYSYGSLAGAVGMYDHRYRLNTPYADTWHRNCELIEGSENGTHVTDLVAADAIRYITQERSRPFFLYLPFHAVHTPIAERDPRWSEMNAHIEDEDRRLFLSAASHVDDAIGRVINAVALENTLIIFTSDNGGIHTNYGGGNYPAPDPSLRAGFSSNAPLRGGKTNAYEGGERVPAFVTWVGTLEPGRIDARMHAVDWVPTLANLLGYTVHGDPHWDGQDVWPLITRQQAGYDQPRDIYTVWGDGRWLSLHHGDMKIVRSGNQPWQLYDLANDPNETTDLAEQQPEQLQALVEIFEQYRASDPR